MAKQPKQARAARRPAAGPASENIWLWGGLLVALVLLVYWPTLDNRFIWDDGQHVLNNPVLRTGQGLIDLWTKPRSIPQYYPLVHTSFWLEYRFWGTNPRGYHAVNMVLHALAAVLLWRVLARLKVPGSWFAAALFAVHPIYVESVAWITERKNVLSLVFALASIWAYLRFLPAEPSNHKPTDDAPADWRYYALSGGLFVCALLSKTVTASVPAVLLVIYWWKQGRLPWKQVGLLAPFFVVGGLLASVTVHIERTHVGAQGAEWDFSPLERGLIAGRAVWFYASKVIWPHPLVFFYPRWTIDPRLWWQWIFPLAAIALLVGLWLARNRIGRGPLAAALIFGGVLVPALGFFNVYPFRYSFVADHFQYHASIALVAVLAAAAVGAARAVGRQHTWFPMAGGAALLIALGLAARAQTHVYQDVRTLYEHTLAWNPNCWAARSNLAYYWMNQGKYDQAIAEYRRCLEIAPATERWLAYVSIGNCLHAQGQVAEALAYYQQAMQVATPQTMAAVHTHLGSALLDLQRYAEALAHYDDAQRLNPEVMTADNRLSRAVCLERLGEHARAATAYREVIDMNPGVDPGVYLRAAETSEQGGQLEQAVPHYVHVLQSNPSSIPVRNKLAGVLLRLGRFDQAAPLLRETLNASAAGPDRDEAQRLWQQLVDLQAQGDAQQP